MLVSLQHVGVGCNRVVGAVSWGPGGLVAFAAHNAVVVYDPQEGRVVATVLGHTAIVNCVCWVPPAHFGAVPGGTSAALLASGAADNTVRLWLWQPQSPEPWRPLAVLEGHSAPVTSLTTFSPAPGQLLLASTAGDGDVCVWECAPGAAGAAQAAWRLRQRIHVGAQLQNCAALARLPQDPDWLVLALGGVDSHVRLYTCPPGGEFGEVCRLSGHQDWVRSLAFARMDDDGRLLLASASQDKYVRIWSIQIQGDPPRGAAPATTAAAAAAAPAAAVVPDLAQQIARYAPKPRIATPAHSYSATLEALLIGHEDWVHSVAWHPPVPAAGGAGGWAQRPCLLSASMDRSMMLWRPDRATGLWMSVETVGDAGPNHLGYYTGTFNEDGSGILAHGFTGALHIWRREGGAWVPKPALGGHFGPVVDACWGADDGCLLSVSTDQTARITARLHDGQWCEIARPQVHGHDFSCAAFLPAAPGAAPGRYLYASGSEEKVVRVFEAPQAFRDTLAMARGEAVGPHADSRSALGAALPALGLSNKAVYAEAAEGPAAMNGSRVEDGGGVPGASYADGPDFAPNSAPSAVAGPPLEEHLQQNTLWPEVRKLYGHGNELYCLAADPRGAYFASACRAQSAATAGIWLWDTAKWVGLAPPLEAHNLTVTQLAFSPDGHWLASGSRDRSIAVFERRDGASPPFRLACKVPKAHSRIVWGLAWSPDSLLLATGSRDNSVRLWAPLQQAQQQQAGGEAGAGGGLALLGSLPFRDAVRAVAFAPFARPAAGTAAAGGSSGGSSSALSYWLAVGLEDGSIHLLELRCSSGSSSSSSSVGEGGAATAADPPPALLPHEVVWQSSCYDQHAAAVRQLCWRRDADGSSAAAGADGAARFHLASCGDDHAVRVFAVEL